GKSTLLSIMSAAKPRIANYHFTTLSPNLGVVKVEERSSFVIADIPGLIEGAHEGTGLGHEFLRHIERTRLLVHVLDISGFEGRQPLEDFYKINEELEKYNSKLKDKPQIVAANKIDITGAKENYNIIKNELEEKGIKVYPISAATYEGIDNLKYAMWNKLKEIEKDYSTFDDEIDLSDLKEDKEQIIVKKEDGKYIVEGEFIEK